MKLRRVLFHLDTQEIALTKLRPTGNTTHKIYDPLGPALVLAISPNKSLRHNFADSLNPLFSCSFETESTLHFFLRWQNYTTLRRALMTESKNINDAIM